MKNPLSIGAGTPQPFLKKEKSVRTTFKLSERSLSDIESTVKMWEGISRKDMVEMAAVWPKEFFGASYEADLMNFAEEQRNSDSGSHTRRSFVISKDSLRKLNHDAKAYGISRDLFVNFSLQMVSNWFLKAKELSATNAKKVISILEDVQASIWDAEYKIQAILGRGINIYHNLDELIADFETDLQPTED